MIENLEHGSSSLDVVRDALDHREPERIPFDFGGHLITGIHLEAYRNLLSHLAMTNPEDSVLQELASREPEVERYRQRTARIDEEIFLRFKADFRPLVPPVPDLQWSEGEGWKAYRDEWGVLWKRPLPEGLYFEHNAPALEEIPDRDSLERFPWPDYGKPQRITGLAERCREISARGKVPILDLPLGLELFDGCFNICGTANFYMLLALDPDAACYMMDRQLEQQLAWWSQAIEAMPELFLIRIGDDLGAQDSMLISPEMYRELVLPRHRKLFQGIKKVSAGRVKIIMHSDGAILPVIPDLIDAGIDCLNPVQYTVHGIDPVQLKREYGRDLVFWGGGVDTQAVLPTASPQAVKDEVRRQIDILAPGGGFVFSQVHIIQSDVPPENIVAMVEAVKGYG